MINKPHAFLSLHRYFIWANHLRDYFDAAIKMRDGSDVTAFANDIGLFMAHWYGALYVVVEGWKELDLHDPNIDKLLQSQNVELLKRFRHGAFHFQKHYFDDRFDNFWKNSQDTVPWVRKLNSEFGYYFLREFQAIKNKNIL